VPSTPRFQRCHCQFFMAMRAATPRKRRQGLATSPQSEEKNSLPQRPRPASPLQLQPAATKSRAELSGGSRMLVGPGASAGTPT